MRPISYLIACSAIATAAAQAAPAEPAETWTYEATPYLNAAGLYGTVGARRVTAPVDLSSSDILSHLDFIFQGAFLARKGQLSFGLDAEYVRLSDDGSRSVTGPRGRADVLGSLDAKITLSILQGNVGWRILDEQTKLDIIGGLRLTRLHGELDLNGTLSVGDEVFGASRSLSDSKTWADGVVGARVQHPVSDKVTLLGYADVGGGGSNLTWQVLAGLNWQVNKNYDVRFGYREISWDYSGSSGLIWHTKMRGPYVGLGIRF
jgi:opacity protein-like surface antigen